MAEEEKVPARNVRRVCPVTMSGFEVKGAKFEEKVIEEAFNCVAVETVEQEIKEEIERYNAKGLQAVKTFLGPVRELTDADKRKYSAIPKTT